MFFDSLSNSLAANQPPKPIDWYAFGDRWDHSQRQFTAVPQGDTYAAALAIAHELHLAPADVPATHPAATEIK
jgi:alpha-N-acetylglucosaminidase